MNKEVKCGGGRIYFGNILQSGKMSANNKFDITESALEAVLNHIMRMNGFAENGFAGYEYKKTTDGTITLCLIDNDMVHIVPNSYSNNIFANQEEEHKNIESVEVVDNQEE